MEQADFEQAVLRMAHHGGVQRLTPQGVAYQLRMDVKDAERMLDRMVTTAQIELDSDDDGNLFYFVPGLGTPGVFTAGTSAASPAEPPKPPAPAYGAAQYGTPAGSPYGAPATSQYGTPPSQYGAPGSSPYGAPPASPYGSPPTAPYGPPGAYGRPAAAPPGPAPAGGPGSAVPPYGAYAPPTAPPTPYGQYGGTYGAPGQGAPSQAPPQGAAPYGAYGAQFGRPYGAPPGPQWSPNQWGPQAGPYGPPPAYGQNALVPTSGPAAPHSPSTAALLGMIPGAGQLYNGQVGKGLTVFFVTAMLASVPPLMVIPWLWGIIDAHATARRQNAQQHYGLLGP